MKTFIVSFILLFPVLTQAQSKKELLAEIDLLRMQVKEANSKIGDAEQKARLANQKVDYANAQAEEIKKENERLLGMVNNFTTVSLKKTANVETSLNTIKEKDAQLKVVNDALEKADADRLAALTAFKDNLGGVGKISVQNNSVIISIANTDLYTSTDTDVELNEKGKAIIGKIAGVLVNKPEYNIKIEGNSNATQFTTPNATNNWDLSARQAAAIANTMQTDYQVNPKNVTVVAKADTNTELIDTNTRIIIDSNFEDFFSLIKDRMKK